MKQSKFLKAVPANEAMCFILLEKETGIIIVQYRMSPYGSLMDNAELTSDIMEAYEKYYKAIVKNR